MIFVAETANGARVEWRDTKRWLWLASLVIPFYAIGAVAWYVWVAPVAWVTLVPFLLQFVATPIADALVGEDTSNPPEEVVEQLAADNYYRVLLHVSVPLYWLSFLVSAWFVGTQDLPFWAMAAMALSAGYTSGTAITVGHELGHKQSRLDRWMARLALAVSGYAHFCIEHNRGHHTHVATPEDPASARLGESVYAFAAREVPGTLRRGLAHERERLRRKGLGFWTWRNDILQGWALTLAVQGTLVALFGWTMLFFLVVHDAVAWYALTQANYIEHYGLKRLRRPNGRYEPVRPEHSWNTNHRVSNLMLFHLQRHSDHHANPSRPYQSLRDFADLPRLPSGYPGCFVLAAVPPLWRRVMDPKVMAWAGGDIARVNTGS